MACSVCRNMHHRAVPMNPPSPRRQWPHDAGHGLHRERYRDGHQPARIQRRQGRHMVRWPLQESRWSLFECACTASGTGGCVLTGRRSWVCIPCLLLTFIAVLQAAALPLRAVRGAATRGVHCWRPAGHGHCAGQGGGPPHRAAAHGRHHPGRPAGGRPGQRARLCCAQLWRAAGFLGLLHPRTESAAIAVVCGAPGCTAHGIAFIHNRVHFHSWNGRLNCNFFATLQIESENTLHVQLVSAEQANGAVARRWMLLQTQLGNGLAACAGAAHKLEHRSGFACGPAFRILLASPTCMLASASD